jgi:hypothetical protein
MNHNDTIVREHTFTDQDRVQYYKVVIRRFIKKPELVYYETQSRIGDEYRFKLYYSEKKLISSFRSWQKVVSKVPDFVEQLLDISQPCSSVVELRPSFYEWLSND